MKRRRRRRRCNLDTSFALALFTAATAASALTLGGLGVASIALTATIAPAQTLMVCGVGGTLAYVGDRQAKGLPVIPGTGDDSKKADAKPAEAAA